MTTFILTGAAAVALMLGVTAAQARPVRADTTGVATAATSDFSAAKKKKARVVRSRRDAKGTGGGRGGESGSGSGAKM
jgi:hypothetical protein